MKFLFFLYNNPPGFIQVITKEFFVTEPQRHHHYDYTRWKPLWASILWLHNFQAFSRGNPYNSSTISNVGKNRQLLTEYKVLNCICLVALPNSINKCYQKIEYLYFQFSNDTSICNFQQAYSVIVYCEFYYYTKYSRFYKCFKKKRIYLYYSRHWKDLIGFQVIFVLDMG